MSERSIVVISAGLSQPSSTRLLADRLADATVAELAARGITARVQNVELRDLAHEVVNTMLTGFATGELAAALDAVKRADGVIAVTPIFSASYSGLFKTFFDVLEKGTLDGKPVLVAATAGTLDTRSRSSSRSVRCSPTCAPTSYPRPCSRPVRTSARRGRAADCRPASTGPAASSRMRSRVGHARSRWTRSRTRHRSSSC